MRRSTGELATTARWNPATRIAFRFVFSYFCLFFVIGQLIDLLPFSDFLARKYAAFWYVIVAWVDKNILHTGYGIYLLEGRAAVSNTAFGSILFLCYVTLAAAATVIWSVLDRRRPHYTRLHQELRLLVRFSLALAMIHYGALKVIPTQMIAPPPLGVLTQRVGDLAPMRLLWIFMGASPAYETFTGCAELLGGVLLLIPRTTLLGALVCCADMVTVFMLNMCYDVHVKLYSFHLLFMSVLLLAPDLRRLADLLLFNRRVEPAEAPPLFAHKWLNRAPQVFLLLVGLYAIGAGFQEAGQRYRQLYPPPPPLYGVWSVEEFAVEGQEVPLFTDAQRWRWVILQNPGALSIERMIGSRQVYTLDLDMKNKTMVLGKHQRDAAGNVVRDAAGQPRRDPGWQARFSWSAPQADVLILDGQVDGRRTHARLRKMALLARRFHWIFDPPQEDR